MKKSDLKDGMMVKTKNGDIFYVLNNQIKGQKHYYSLNEKYREDLAGVLHYVPDIVTVVDAREFKGTIKDGLREFDSHPVLWKREEEYNFKPGDKVQVRDGEDDEWQNTYFIKKLGGTEGYKWLVTTRDEFTAGMSFEEMGGSFGTSWVYIRPYKEG